MRRTLKRILIAAALWPVVASPAPSAAKSAPPDVRIWMRNVVMFPLPNAPATVTRLSGTAVPTRSGRLIDMDDVTSYAVRVKHGEMVIPAASMEALMNQHILPQAKTAIKRVSVTFGNGVIVMRGVLQKGVPVGFTAQAVASPSHNGEMRITVTKMKAAGFIPKSVMDALGLKLSKVAQPNNTGVFRIVGDTMIIPVSSMFPPPRFLGPLRSVRVTPQGLIGVVGTGGDDAPLRMAGPYIQMRGGVLNFAHLTMSPTDLTMVPKTRAATLGFSPAQYYRQLLAGYSTVQADYGLVGHVADFRSLSAR